MEQQSHEFEVPDSVHKTTRGEVELLFPPDPAAVIYSGLQKVFVESSLENVRSTQARPKRRTQARKR